MPPRDAYQPPALAAVRTPAKLSGETFATLINLSGRRRFTSQRLVLYAVLAAQGEPQAVAIACDALKLFRDAHEALIKGNEQVPAIFCDEREQVYFGKEQNERQISAFIALATRTVDALDAGNRQASTLLAELVQGATPLLAILNRITQVYEELSKRHAKQVKKQLAGIMTDIETIARQARMVSFNAQVVAARAGTAGREFSVVAGVLSDITREIDELVRAALENSAA